MDLTELASGAFLLVSFLASSYVLWVLVKQRKQREAAVAEAERKAASKKEAAALRKRVKAGGAEAKAKLEQAYKDAQNASNAYEYRNNGNNAAQSFVDQSFGRREL